MNQTHQQIIALYRAGKGLSEISAAVGLSVPTVCKIATRYCPKRNRAVTLREVQAIEQMQQEGYSRKEIEESLGTNKRRVAHLIDYYITPTP